ncbi:hypothetical protein [Sediminitomix flava]|uniref:Uncharacterized protein n=1 Tax=Sediminitomix flava TaxID=379075 RepID=A0A315YWA5_SEDFL|nr:hypothetical protein [Sediminitomix flava]PWJ33671.1 hypothetical protein BC781_11218 [Sediminitomix flava]
MKNHFLTIFTLFILSSCQDKNLDIPQSAQDDDLKIAQTKNEPSSSPFLLYILDGNEYYLKEKDDRNATVKLTLRSEYIKSRKIDPKDTTAIQPYLKYSSNAKNGIRILEATGAEFDSSLFIRIDQ